MAHEFVYELYNYLDDPETEERIGLVMERERHYTNGAVTVFETIDGITYWWMLSRFGVQIAHGSLCPMAINGEYIPSEWIPTSPIDFWFDTAAEVLKDWIPPAC